MDTLLAVGLNNAIGATLLALPAAALGRFRRWPALAHGLWLLVLLKLISPPLFAVPLPALPAPELSQKEAIAPKRESLLFTRLPELPHTFPEIVLEPKTEAPVVLLGAPEENPPDPVRHEPDAPSTEGESESFSWQAGLVGLWIAGSALWWLVLGVRVRQFQNVLRRVQPAPHSLQEQTHRLAGLLGLKRVPQVGFTTAPISPLVWGLTRTPRLLLPVALWQRLTDEQRETLLVHELAHLRRRDHWVRVLELVILSLYWWHPVAWWARSGLQQAEEQCCDAWVVWALPEKAQAYATALLETVTFLSQSRSPLPVGASGIGKVHFLKRRLTMILRHKAPRGLTWGGLLAVLLLGAFSLPLVATPAEPPREEAPQAQTTTQAHPEKVPVRSNSQKPAATTAQEVGQRDPRQFTTEVVPGTVTQRYVGQKPSSTGAGNAQTTAQWAARSANDEQLQQAKISAEMQKLRDQIELMELPLQVKALQVEVAKKKLEHAKRDLNRVKNLSSARVVSSEEMEKAQEKYDNQELELQIKQAEMREPMLLLQPARRRLVELQGMQSGLAPVTNSTSSGSITLFPKTSVDLGRVVQGTSRITRFSTVNNSKLSAHFKNVRFTSAALTASTEPADLAPGQSGHLTVTVDTKRFTGPKQFQIKVIAEMRDPQNQVVRAVDHTLTVQVDSQPGSSFTETPEPVRDTKESAKVRDLEKKIDRLLKEMDALREELKSRQPDRKSSLGRPDSKNSTNQPVVLNVREMKIPFLVNNENGKVVRLILYSSADEGRTWREEAKAVPEDEHFLFRAPADGTYWLDVCTIDKQGNRFPSDPSRLHPSQKIVVETKQH